MSLYISTQTHLTRFRKSCFQCRNPDVSPYGARVKAPALSTVTVA